MENQEIIDKLKSIEKGYHSLSDKEINEQIEAIFECDYEWTGSSFKNKKTSIYLKIEGLNFYTPDEIRLAYERTWSKQNKDELSIRERQSKILMFFLLSFILYFFLDYKWVLVLQGSLIIVFIIGYKILKEK